MVKFVVFWLFEAVKYVFKTNLVSERQFPEFYSTRRYRYGTALAVAVPPPLPTLPTAPKKCSPMTDLSRSTLVKQLVNYKADDLINPSSKGPLPNALTEKMGNIALDIQVVDDARKKFKNQKKSNGKKGTNNSKYKLEKITTPISPIASDSGSRIIPVTSTLGSIKMH